MSLVFTAQNAMRASTSGRNRETSNSSIRITKMGSGTQNVPLYHQPSLGARITEQRRIASGSFRELSYSNVNVMPADDTQNSYIEVTD
jgi:hypothetical protein